MRTKDELLTIVDKLVLLFEGMTPNQYVLKYREPDFPTIALYKLGRNAKIEIFMRWKAYANPVAVLRDAYAVISKTGYHLINGELCDSVTNYAFITPKRKQSKESLEHMMDTAWFDE
jgi:hypothetical protein